MDKLIESTLQKYGIPEWVKPYIYRYARENPIAVVKFAISLIDVKRRKGELTKDHIKLPNGTEFSIESILKLLNLFYYGEENMARIERDWVANSHDRNAEYERNYTDISETEYRRTRAIKNLAEGLGHSVGEQPESLTRVFDYISKIESWQDRVIVTGIILRYSYATTFGTVFYKVFYPVSPEFMRSFGKAFETKDGQERWDTQESIKLIKENSIDREHVLEISRSILTEVLCSIESNMRLARELGLEKEVRLLGEISIAYPFQRLSEIGLELNVENEVKLVRKTAAKQQAE